MYVGSGADISMILLWFCNISVSYLISRRSSINSIIPLHTVHSPGHMVLTVVLWLL